MAIYLWFAVAGLAWILQSVYRLTLHPLSKFKGPKIAACTSLYYTYWIWRGRFPQKCEQLFQQYNTDVIRVSPGQMLFRTPQSLKDVVGSEEVLRGNFALRVLGFDRSNISSIEGAEHKKKRRMMNPGFSPTTLAKQEPALIRPIVDKLVDKVGAAQGREIDICNYFDSVTSDIIGRLALGEDFKMLDNPDHHEFLHKMPDALRLCVVAQGVPEVYKFLHFLYTKGPRFLTSKTMRGVADFTGKQLRARTERDATRLESEKSRDVDIMSIIINGNAKALGPDQRMSTRELLDEATTLVAGGSDTVATSLTITMWNLLQHPEVYRDLTSQLRATFSTEEAISSKAIATDVPLLDAAMNESMRINPVLPGPSWRRNPKPLVVDGHLVPANTDIGIARQSLFQNPDAFHSPKEFIPARWLEDMEDNREAFQPFGIGPRTCPGRYIARVEMRLTIALLLWKFDWELITQEYDNLDYVVLYRAPLILKPTRHVF